MSFGDLELWESRPLLRHIKTVADKRLLSPHAVLGWILAIGAFRIPYWCKYSSYKGKASPNLIINISGPTGVGKSIIKSAVVDHFDFGRSFEFPDVVQAGSGEAIADSFFKRVKMKNEDGSEFWADDWVNKNHSRIFHNDEIDFHKGKANQTTSTLDATYLSLYSGEKIGRTLANFKGREVPAGEYRGIAIFNSQPERDPFRSSTSIYSGLTSRLLNLNAVNPNILADHALAAEPGIFEVDPTPKTQTQSSTPNHFKALPEMEEAHYQEDIRAHLGKRDSSHSHTLLTQAKVACILANLDGRAHIVSEDWGLASLIVSHSLELDKQIRETLAISERKELAELGRSAGLKSSIADGVKRKRDIKRVAKNIVRKASESGLTLETDEEVRQVRKMIAWRDRDLMDEAMELIARGLQSSESEEDTGIEAREH